MSKAKSSFTQSLERLKKSLTYEKEAADHYHHALAITKAFEVCFEYAWKYMKQEVQEAGLEAYSPRDVIKIAPRCGLIDNPESWLGFLEDRNLSVHDYIGIETADYLKTIHAFVKESEKLLKLSSIKK